MTGKTRCVAILGYPVEHSFSPQMHQAAFEALHLDYCYIPLNISPPHLKKTVSALKMFNFKGFNVTVPHKEKMVSFMDELSPEASMIGAVNTVLIEDGKSIGFNTDGSGFIESLRKEWKYSVKNKTVTLLGAGGAAKAVGTQLCFEKVKAIGIANRTLSNSILLRKQLNQYFPEVEIITLPFKGSVLRTFIKKSDLVIHTTPLGLKTGDPFPCPPQYLFKGLRVYDLIYNPPRTRFLKAAEQMGCKIINGSSMLVYQGALAFEIWTGRKAPVSIMRNSIGLP